MLIWPWWVGVHLVIFFTMPISHLIFRHDDFLFYHAYISLQRHTIGSLLGNAKLVTLMKQHGTKSTHLTVPGVQISRIATTLKWHAAHIVMEAKNVLNIVKTHQIYFDPHPKNKQMVVLDEKMLNYKIVDLL